MSLKLSVNNDDLLNSLHGKSHSSLMHSVSDRGSIPDQSSSLSISYKRVTSTNKSTRKESPKESYWSKNINNNDILDNESLEDELRSDDGDDTDQDTVIGINEEDVKEEGNRTTSTVVVSDWLARCEGSVRNYEQWDVELPRVADKHSHVRHNTGDTTGNTTDRTSLSSSDWGDDVCEFDRLESQRVRHMFDEIERMLFDDHNSDAIHSHPPRSTAPMGFLLAPAMSSDIYRGQPPSMRAIQSNVRSPGQHLQKECQQWVGRFPHFRLSGIQILPSQETGFSQHTPPAKSLSSSEDNLSPRPCSVSPNSAISTYYNQGTSSSKSRKSSSVSWSRQNDDAISTKTIESPRSTSFIDFESISVRGSSMTPCSRAALDTKSYESGYVDDQSYEEIFISDGEYQEVIAVDFKLPEEDYRSEKGHFKRRIRGYPPLSPHAALRDTILSNIFDSIWQETITWSRPLIKERRQRSIQTVEILPTEVNMPASILRPSSCLSRASTSIANNAAMLDDILKISPKTLQQREVNKPVTLNDSLEPSDPASLNSFATASTGSLVPSTGRMSPTKSTSGTPLQPRSRTPTSLHLPSQQHSPMRSAMSTVRPSSQNSTIRPTMSEQRSLSPTRPASSILIRSNPNHSLLRPSSVKTGESRNLMGRKLSRPISVALGSRAVIHEKFRASEPDRIAHFEQSTSNLSSGNAANNINRGRNLQPHYPYYNANNNRPNSSGVDSVSSKLASLPPISSLRTGRVGSAVPHYYKINQAVTLAQQGMTENIKRPATTQSVRGDNSLLRRSSTPLGLRSNNNHLGVHGSSIISMNPGLRSSASSPVSPGEDDKTKKKVGNNNWGIYPTPQPFTTPFRRAKQSNSYFR